MSDSASSARTSLAILLLAGFLLLGATAPQTLAQTPSSCSTTGYTAYTLNVTYDSGTDQTTYDITMHNLTPVLGTFVNIGEVFIFGLPSPVSTSSPPGWVFKEIGPKTFWDTTSSPWWKTPPAIKPMGDLSGFQYKISGAPQPITAIVTHVQQVTDATGQTSLPSTWFDCSVAPGGKCIDVTKSANPTTGPAGTVITYTFAVHNCGRVTLTDVTVNDSLLGDITAAFIAANSGSDTLVSGATVVFAVNRTIQTTDPIDLENVVTACGTAPDQMQACDSDSETVTVQKPCIDITKTPNPTQALVGQNVQYSFVVSNCGNLAINNVTVTDTVLGNLTALFVAANGGSNTLAVGASVPFSTTRAIQAGDPDPLTDIVTASGQDPYGTPVSDHDRACVDIIPNPPAEVSIAGAAFDDLSCDGVKDPGDPPLHGATFRLTYQNGTYPVIDANSIPVADQTGATYNFVHLVPGTYRVVETNPAGYASTNAIPGTCAGSTKITNDIIEVAATVGGVACISNDFLDCQSNPCIEITKAVDPIEAPVGTTVTYTFTVHNCGNVLLTNITIVDTLLGDITAAFVAAHGSNTLAPTVTVIFSVQRVVTAEQPNPIPNTVTVTGDDPFGNQVSDSDDGLVTIPITISGGAFQDFNCDGIKDPDDTPLSGATYELTGIFGNSVRDIFDNIVVHQTGPTFLFKDLPPGIYVVTETNPAGYVSTNALPGFNAVKLTNDKIQVNAVVHTNYPYNNFLDCNPNPCIGLQCGVSPQVVHPGDTVTGTLTVCNCGPCALQQITVISNVCGDLTDLFKAANGGKDTLAVGQCVTFSVQHVIPVLQNLISSRHVSGGVEIIFITTVSGRCATGGPVTDETQTPVVVTPHPGENRRRCFLPVTFTPQGWSNFCDPANPIIPGGMVYNRFSRAFANWTFYGAQVSNRLIVGRRYTIIFEGPTSGLIRLCMFLTTDGGCGALRRNYVNPWQGTDAGALGVETVALLMNIAYNDKRLMPRMPGYDLEDFTLATSRVKGRTVGDVLDIANQVLSGIPPSAVGLINCAELVPILDAINSNYEFVDFDTFNDSGYLIPNRPFGVPDPPHDPVVP